LALSRSGSLWDVSERAVEIRGSRHSSRSSTSSSNCSIRDRTFEVSILRTAGVVVFAPMPMVLGRKKVEAAKRS
jgi:uncharacterized membrane protein